MIADFIEWYDALASYMQVFWTIAIVTSVVFLMQMILTFVGIGDTDADFGGDVDFSDGTTLDVGGAMQLFSIRNFINFMLGFGWGGVCFASVVPNKFWLTVVAILIGASFVLVFIFMYRQVFRLEKNGAFVITDCVGKTVDVYLTIPARRSGKGKVQVSFFGSVQELSAITDEPDAIHSGAKVKVLEVIDDTSVLVTSL